MGPSMGLNHAVDTTSNLLGVKYGGKWVAYHGFSSIYILSLSNCDWSVDIFMPMLAGEVVENVFYSTCGEGSCHPLPPLQSGLLRKEVQLLVKPMYRKKVFYLHHRNYAEVRGFRYSCFLFCDDEHWLIYFEMEQLLINSYQPLRYTERKMREQKGKTGGTPELYQPQPYPS